MHISRRLKDANALEQYRAILLKSGSHADISLGLEKIAYSKEILECGKGLLKKSREIYDENIQKRDEYAFARVSFTKKKHSQKHV